MARSPESPTDAAAPAKRNVRRAAPSAATNARDSEPGPSSAVRSDPPPRPGRRKAAAATEAARANGNGNGNRRVARASTEPAVDGAPHGSGEHEEPSVGFVRGTWARLRGKGASLSAASFERLRAPALLVGRILVVLVALAGAGAVGRLAERHVRTSPAFAIRSLVVHGEERLSEAEILTAAGLAPGRNVFEVPPEDVHARLVRHPWIADATVRRRLPGTFELTIRERKPAALLELDRLYLVGQDATVFKVLGPEDPVDLPVITGIELSRFTTDRGYRASVLLEIVALLHDFRGAGLARRTSVEEIHVERDGSISIYVGEQATYVRLGRGPFQAKLRKLRRVMDELERRDASAAYVYLDNVRRPDRVTVRLRETPAPVSDDPPASDAVPASTRPL